MTTLYRHISSIVIALCIILAICGLWNMLANNIQYTLIGMVLAFCVAIAFITVEFFRGRSRSLNISTLQWQSAPIAAGAMLLGWTIRSIDKSDGADALVVAVGIVLILFSSVVVAEAFHPESGLEHRETNKSILFKRISLFAQLLVQAVVAFLIGLVASYVPGLTLAAIGS